MKIAFFNTTEKEQQAFFENKLSNKGLEMVFFETEKIEENLNKIVDIDGVVVFCNTKITKEVIDSLPNLKFIATRSTGFDHIDCKYAEQKGIIVSSVPEYGSSTVAEYTFALLLNITRKVYAFSERTDRGDYTYKDLRGVDLFGKTIGVVGVGKIGRRVISIANGFGMKVLVYERTKNPQLAKELNFEDTDSLEDLLSRSDVITFHVPYNEGTHHLINLENVTKIKKGAILLNTSRGPVVSNEAVAKGLKEGYIEYAGLDVIEDEEDLLCGHNAKLAKHLAELPEVIYSPHVAYYTKGAVERILQTTVENILAFAKGQPINVVKV